MAMMAADLYQFDVDGQEKKKASEQPAYFFQSEPMRSVTAPSKPKDLAETEPANFAVLKGLLT